MWSLISAFLPLIALLGVLYFVLKYVRNSGFNIKGQRVKRFKIKVLAGQMIMPKKFISVVQVEDKVLVLGIGETITLLKELDQSYIQDNDNEIIKSDDNFFSTLKKNLGMK